MSRQSKPAIDPARWQPPANTKLRDGRPPGNIAVYSVSGYGPEDVNLLDDGRVVTGLADGRIVTIDPQSGAEVTIADTGGRPLGIERAPSGGLIVCDAYEGLLHIDEVTGAIATLEIGFKGVPFMFCNNAAVASDDTIYFTDSSNKFSFEHWRGDLMEHRPTGRLFRRTSGGALTLLADGLAFANGVALAPDESHLIVAQTGAYALTRYWLKGDRAGEHEAFGAPLPGFPDNISTGEDGNIWVTIASPRDAALDKLLPRAGIVRKLIWALPPQLQPQPKSFIQILVIDQSGTIVHTIDGKHPNFGKATGVRQIGETVWLGSFEQETIARIDYPSSR